MSKLNLPTQINSALAQVKQMLVALYGEKLSALYLYGSYARGDFHEGSDVDLMIALKGEINSGQEVNRMSSALADICLKYDLLIATYPVPEKWLQDRQGPLFINVRREGIRL